MFPDLKSIKLRRARLGLKQYEFAKAAGVSQSMLAKVEKGDAIPSYETAVKIFDKLDELEHKGEKTAGELMHKGVISFKDTDTVGEAKKQAIDKDISQFPVVANGEMVGRIQTSDLIDLSNDIKIKWLRYGPRFPTVDISTPIGLIKDLLKSKEEQAVIVMEKKEMVGIITAQDLL